MKLKKTHAESLEFYADERAVIVYDRHTEREFVFDNGVTLAEMLEEVTR